MTTEISSETASAADTSAASADVNADTSSQTNPNEIFSGKPVSTGAAPAAPAADPAAAQAAGANQANTTTPVVGADGKVAYVPNYKYKAALQEKELDPFFHSLIKDAESEKKVKELFTKADALDFMKSKKEAIEQQHSTLMNDYDSMSKTVTNFNQSVAQGDLSSAFRMAGITKEQVFKWAQQQIALMEMPEEQRKQYEQAEQAREQKDQIAQQYSQLKQQYENVAVQARTTQLDVTLSRPEVAQFAAAWDRNSEPGAFRNFVAEEARKVYYETLQSGKPVDLSPEQAVAMVMQRFGKFLNVGDSTSQSPQAIQGNGQRQPPPVIPNVTGKAASPIKRVPRSLDDLKKLAKEARMSDG